MTAKEFYRAVSNGKSDVLELLIEIFSDTQSAYCVIGGLAVNAYVEPIVSLDVDVVVAVDNLDGVLHAAAAKGFAIERLAQSVNLTLPDSDLRVQIQTDPWYQTYLSKVNLRSALGYEMLVARIEDVLEGKLRASRDPARRPSKRQKDLSDILRIVETYPDLEHLLPPGTIME